MGLKKLKVLIFILILVLTMSACTGDIASDIYTLTVGLDGEGMVKLDKDNGSESLVSTPGETEEVKIEEDAIVELIVEPEIGWEFDDWIGPDGNLVKNETNNRYKIKVDKNSEIVAQFKESYQDTDFYKIKDLIISPEVVSQDDTITIEAEVENIGGKSGNQDIELSIINEKENIESKLSTEENISLEPDEKEDLHINLDIPGDLADGEYLIEISSNDHNKTEEIFVGNIDGLIFEHELVVEKDTSDRPKMRVEIKNVKEDILELDVIGTVHGNIADSAEPDEKLFEFIDYDTMVIKNSRGEKLDYSKDRRKIDRDNHVWDEFFMVDGLDIKMESSQTVIIEYELLSNPELWEGFGGDVSDFRDFDDPGHFWPVYLEWFILRPREQRDGVIYENTFKIDLPKGFNYAATYPNQDDNLIDLGDLEYMRWTNSKEWENFQRAPFVLYDESSYNIDTKFISGTLFQDVYHKKYENIRNHEANYQFVSFLSEFFGELPFDKVLYFSNIEVDGGTGSLDHGNAYARAPYGYGYGSMGKFFTSGAGADVGHTGSHLDEPPIWSITRWPDEDYCHLFQIHPTVRLWVGALSRGHKVTEGLAAYAGSQAVASYYTDWDVNKHRYQRKYEFYLEEVVQPDGSEEEVKAITGHGFHGYFKGSLTFFYLDELIKDKSEGTRNLSDALNYYFKQLKSGQNDINFGEVEDLLIESLKYAAEGYVDDNDIEYAVKYNIFGDRYEHKFLDLSDYLDVNLDDYDIPYN